MMQRFKILGLTLCVVASVMWLLIAGRQLSLILFIPFMAALFKWRNFSSAKLTVLLGLAFFSVSWMPFDITTENVPGGPKFITCCPGAPYVDKGDTLQKAQRGQCMWCSDLVNGFEPRYYLVW